MKSFLKAVFKDEVASVTLDRKWNDVNGESPWKAARDRFEIVLYLLLCLSASVSLFFNGDFLAKHIMAVGIVLVLVTTMAGLFVLLNTVLYLSCGFADQRFLRDCYKLQKYISDAGRLTEGELREMTEKTLVGLAHDIFCAEKAYGRLAPETDEARGEFKKAHELMLRFGLAEEEDSRYFAQAETLPFKDPGDTLLADAEEDEDEEESPDSPESSLEVTPSQAPAPAN